MTLSMPWRGLAATATAVLFALLAPLAHAQSGSATGTYMVEGGSYMIELRQDGDTLTVIEPNKESPYARQGDGSYTFYNPNTETNYGIRILDANTIEAFKPDHPESEPTRLVRLGGGHVASDDAEPAASADTDRYGAMAEHYQQLAQDDPDNVQAWTACSAVALKRSMSNDAEADAYATQMAGMLQQMDVSSSPCPDAMPGW